MFNNPHVKKEIKMHDLHIQIKGRIPDIPISIYWLLTHVSGSSFNFFDQYKHILN